MVSHHVFIHAFRPTPASVQLGTSLQLSRLPLRSYKITSNGVNSQRGLLRSSTPAPASANDSTISARVRTLMRSTPHPLTTIISYAPNPSGSNGTTSHTPYGLLVSSFNTIALDPKPYVSFNIKRPSRTYDAINQSGLFTASCMSDAIVAHAFVKDGGSTEVWEQMIGEGGKLNEGKGGVWWMSCSLMRKNCVEVGDHVIIVGEVVNAAAYRSGEGEMGLVYAEGKYRKVNTVLDVDT